LADNFSRPVIKRKRVLKLFRKGAAADSSHIHEQAVLRIIKLQAGIQFALLMYALADDPRRQDRRRHARGLVSHYAVVRAHDHALAAIRRALRKDGKNSL